MQDLFGTRKTNYVKCWRESLENLHFFVTFPSYSPFISLKALQRINVELLKRKKYEEDNDAFGAAGCCIAKHFS